MVNFLIALILSSSVHAGEWWSTPRIEDETHIYYVGVSEGKDTLSNLQDAAFNKAMGDLIRENFGMSIQISEKSVEDLSNDSFQVVTKQSSAPLFIKGITLLHTFEKEMSEGKRVYVQIRVLKTSLKESVEQHIADPANEPFNTYGDSNASKVNIKVKTHPSGALITFTHHDKRYTIQGQGNAIFHLPHGRYQMVVSSPGYMVDSKEITILAPDQEETVILEQLHTELLLELEPANAKVELDGKETTSSSFKLAVGKSHRFRFSHPDYLSQEVEILSNQPEVIERDIHLEPKMSTLNYEVQPHNASIEVDGKEMKPYQGRIHVKAGRRIIKISQKYYFDHVETIQVKPNRDYPLRVIYLKDDSEIISPSDKRVSLRFEYNPFTFQGDQGRFNLLPIALHAEWHYISIGAGLAYSVAEKDEKDQNGTTYKKEKTDDDFYGTVRLITPRMGPFKIFASGTIGQSSTSLKYKNTLKEEKTSSTYKGLGGGFRIYISPRWSAHAEYFRLKSVNTDTEIQKKEDRVLAGFSYEF